MRQRRQSGPALSFASWHSLLLGEEWIGHNRSFDPHLHHLTVAKLLKGVGAHIELTTIVKADCDQLILTKEKHPAHLTVGRRRGRFDKDIFRAQPNLHRTMN